MMVRSVYTAIGLFFPRKQCEDDCERDVRAMWRYRELLGTVFRRPRSQRLEIEASLLAVTVMSYTRATGRTQSRWVGSEDENNE